MNEALLKSRSRSFFDFASGCPLGTASIKLIESTLNWDRSLSVLAMENKKPASSWPDRTPSICSREYYEHIHHLISRERSCRQASFGNRRHEGRGQGDCRPFSAWRRKRHHHRTLRPDGKDGQQFHSGRCLDRRRHDESDQRNSESLSGN